MRTSPAYRLATAIAVMMMPQFGLPASVRSTPVETSPTPTAKTTRRLPVRPGMKLNSA